MQMRKRLLSTISVLLGLFLFVAILYHIGWTEAFHQIRQLGVAGGVALLLSMGLAFALEAAAWRTILHAYEINSSRLKTLGAFASGYAVSYLTPSMYLGGELVRAHLIHRDTSAPGTKITATIIVERLLNGAAMISFIVLASLFGSSTDLLPSVQKWMLYLWAAGGMAFIGLWILSFTRNYMWISRSIFALRRVLPGKEWLTKVGEKVAAVEIEIHAAFTYRLRRTGIAFALSLSSALLIYLRPQIFFYFTEGRLLSGGELFLIFAFCIFLTGVLWITPGGIGIAEVGMVGFLGLLGISQGGALAFAFAVKGIELILLSLGFTYLMHRGLTRMVGRRSVSISPPRSEVGVKGVVDESEWA
ncbi:MAG: lysylphosphatidylglycerol synthase transmembrane domain-containing protein [Candidatus Bipolaricaulia bacterium]